MRKMKMAVFKKMKVRLKTNGVQNGGTRENRGRPGILARFMYAAFVFVASFFFCHVFTHATAFVFFLRVVLYAVSSCAMDPSEPFCSAMLIPHY